MAKLYLPLKKNQVLYLWHHATPDVKIGITRCSIDSDSKTVSLCIHSKGKEEFVTYTREYDEENNRIPLYISVDGMDFSIDFLRIGSLKSRIIIQAPPSIRICLVSGNYRDDFDVQNTEKTFRSLKSE